MITRNSTSGVEEGFCKSADSPYGSAPSRCLPVAWTQRPTKGRQYEYCTEYIRHEWNKYNREVIMAQDEDITFIWTHSLRGLYIACHIGHCGIYSVLSYLTRRTVHTLLHHTYIVISCIHRRIIHKLSYHTHIITISSRPGTHRMQPTSGDMSALFSVRWIHSSPLVVTCPAC